MKHPLTRALILLILGALALPVSAQILTAKVTGGTVQGVANDGIAVYKGIPFAAPPTGNNRWRAPQPVEPWSGVKHADHFGPACMQPAGMLKFIGSDAGTSEDCLYLDVWTPAKTAVAVSDLMSRYWTNFAKTGDPNGPGLPKWPAFNAAHQQAMVFGEDGGSARPFPNLKKLEAMDAYFAWRRKNPE